jgi:hypothetical protein
VLTIFFLLFSVHCINKIHSNENNAQKHNFVGKEQEQESSQVKRPEQE